VTEKACWSADTDSELIGSTNIVIRAPAPSRCGADLPAFAQSRHDPCNWGVQPAARICWQTRVTPGRTGARRRRPIMASRIGQIIPADGWYAVYARTGAAHRGRVAPSGTRPSSLPGTGAIPEFVPVLAWALIFDDSEGKNNRVVGVIMGADQVPEVMRADDPSFLGYAGPGDPGVDRVSITPDWRGLAKEAMTQLRQR
jgi:hypothetical protein